MIQRANTPVPTEKGQRSKTAILRAAVPLLADQGFRGTSLASIAADAEITQQGLLHHFPSKERLLVDLLAAQDQDDGRLLAEILDQTPSPDRSGLTEVMRALVSVVSHNQETPEKVKLFTVLAAEAISEQHPGHEFFCTRYERLRLRMLDALVTARELGDIRPEVDLEALAPVLLAVMDGLQVQWLLDPKVDMTKSFRIFCDLISAALSP